MIKPQRALSTAFLAQLLFAAAPLGAAADTACGNSATAIHEIQGAGDQSPLAGKRVTVEGILTRDSRQAGGFGGFYLQQADHETDNNPGTSEALFVYTRKPGGKPGQRMRVTGQVTEFHGLTELTKVKALTACEHTGLPASIAVSLPWTQPPESLENMRVRFTGPLTLTDSYNLARYGELVLAAHDQIIATEYLPPGREARALAQHNHHHRVLLDDGLGIRNPEPVPWLGQHALRAGDTVSGLEGVLDYRFGQWRIQPTRTPHFESGKTRPAPPVKPPSSLRVMTLNLQNYFNGNGDQTGFPTPRGARSFAAFEAQRERLVRTVREARADILAVTELENDGYGPSSASIGLAQALGAGWMVIRTPGQDGSDAIRTSLLYQSDRVSPAGIPHRPGPETPAGRPRPPLAQAFKIPEGDQEFWVVVPHFKSKSCRNASENERDQGDGQGCYNRHRTRSAKALTHWLDQLTGGLTETPVLITGDLNSYPREAPLEHLRKAGFSNLVHRFHPCRPEHCDHYTYRYQGQKGTLDYALASPALLPSVLQAQTWNTNVDEPPALGYRQAPDQSGPWRSSDHNPVLTDLSFTRQP
ncbi:ExeM/NucH family extracellular endonuclease [Marinobacter daepoensis]|uniref:ExeM/NucH family extracellular endonuclease n=1 Tax=Marinobacter daepoensis TaxID=262077 RepID=UPI001C96F2EB|nr:ExeM/NucH family extracellular endonuclease [Marinobacter daepoensis]